MKRSRTEIQREKLPKPQQTLTHTHTHKPVTVKLKQAWNDMRHPHSWQTKVARNSKLRNAMLCADDQRKISQCTNQQRPRINATQKKHIHTNSNKRTTLQRILVDFFLLLLFLSIHLEFLMLDLYGLRPSSAASLLISIVHAFFVSSMLILDYIEISINDSPDS